MFTFFSASLSLLVVFMTFIRFAFSGKGLFYFAAIQVCMFAAFLFEVKDRMAFLYIS